VEDELVGGIVVDVVLVGTRLDESKLDEELLDEELEDMTAELLTKLLDKLELVVLEIELVTERQVRS
jgi:hypothetical protein